MKGENGYTLEARVHTGSSRREIVFKGHEIHIYTSKKPVKGEANLDVVEIISEYFKVPRSSILLVRGERSKVKLFRITGDFSTRQARRQG